MADKLTLTALKREETGKGACRKLRQKGLVPCVFYNAKGDNIGLSVPQMPLAKLYSKAGKNAVFGLTIEGEGSYDCLIWQIVNHPFKNIIESVDFYGVDPEKPLTVSVPVQITGTSKGIKLGGVLEVYRDTLEVICLPANIPALIQIDISDLDINERISIEDISLGEGVEVVGAEDNFAVVGVITAREEEEDEGEEGEAAEEETADEDA